MGEPRSRRRKVETLEAGLGTRETKQRRLERRLRRLATWRVDGPRMSPRTRRALPTATRALRQALVEKRSGRRGADAGGVADGVAAGAATAAPCLTLIPRSRHPAAGRGRRMTAAA